LEWKATMEIDGSENRRGLEISAVMAGSRNDVDGGECPARPQGSAALGIDAAE
jgi:hypothetical protein